MEEQDIKIFICYAREDMATAKKLYKDLQRAGVTPWSNTQHYRLANHHGNEVLKVCEVKI